MMFVLRSLHRLERRRKVEMQDYWDHLFGRPLDIRWRRIVGTMFEPRHEKNHYIVREKNRF
jgi:hypothetical protein